MVRYCGDPVVANMVLSRFPNVVCDPTRSGRVNAWVLGSGWGERADAPAIIDSALATGLPTVIDADGLRHLPGQLRADVVLTPHAGELARMLGTDRSQVESDPIRHAKAAADRWGATLLLKGGNQLVAVPGHDCVYFPLPGPAWTAQAGSGDTLAGAIGTLLANGVPPLWTALLAASLQALTAAEYPGPISPDELASHFRTIIASAVDNTAE
jgi:NAD(P)H-hydrate repair Nnr-like enzyme with NAD(P)H-hydrate dehydratase domain